MLQRIGMAQALVQSPRLLVLDEPTAGVDPLGSRDIRNIIENLKGRGMTVFLCSHLLEQVQEVCDRVGVIFKGLLIAEGSVNELTRDSDKQEILLEHASPELMERLKNMAGEECPARGCFCRQAGRGGFAFPAGFASGPGMVLPAGA